MGKKFSATVWVVATALSSLFKAAFSYRRGLKFPSALSPDPSLLLPGGDGDSVHELHGSPSDHRVEARRSTDGSLLQKLDGSPIFYTSTEIQSLRDCLHGGTLSDIKVGFY